MQSSNSCNVPMAKLADIDLEAQRIPVPPPPVTTDDGPLLDEKKKKKPLEIISADKKKPSYNFNIDEEKADKAEAAADESWNTQQVCNVGVDFDSLANHSRLAYGGIIVSGIVMLVALTLSTNNTHYDHHRYYHYGISVGAVALIVSCLAWGLAEVTWNHTEFFVKNTLAVNYFLFLWCFIGACILTFGGPFNVAGNGYFGSWGLAVFATMAVGVNTDSFQTDLSLGGLATSAPSIALLTSSMVVLVAISTEGVRMDDDNFFPLVYGLVVSLVTIITMGCILELEVLQRLVVTHYVVGAISVMWILSASLLTFRGPFLETGNGYFGAWGGALSSVYAFHMTRRTSATR